MRAPVRDGTAGRLLRFALPLALALAGACGAAPREAGATERAAPVVTPALDAWTMPARWIDGTSADDPPIQWHRAAEGLWVLRQSLRTNREAPFLYLLVGSSRSLLLDSGAGGIDLVPAVDALLSATGLGAAREHRLVVAHSHAHGDHVAGDAEFARRPLTTVVGTRPEEVAAFFGIERWPEEIVPFDLGGRVLDVIPLPGHEPSHVALYDRRTGILLTGDSLYPGRLYVPEPDFAAFVASIDRLAAFAETHPVTGILGTHVEMTTRPGEDYPPRAVVRPDERRLELGIEHLRELRDALHSMAGAPRRDVRADFIVQPVKPRGR